VAQNPLPLHVAARHETQEFAHGIPEPIKCDIDGDIYFQTASPMPMGTPITRIARDGSTATRFEFAKGDNAGGEMSDFAIADGRLYGVMRKKDRNYLVAFTKDGQVEKTTQVSTDFGVIIIRNFAAFSPDLFLISGSIWQNGKEGRGFTGLMAADGQIVKEISLKGDVDAQKDGGNIPLYGPSWVADDGYAYLMRTPASGARFFVISPSGEVVRSVTVDAPAPGASAASFGVSHGQLAVYFSKSSEKGPDTVWFKVVNSSSGQEIATYTTGDELKGIFVCFNSAGFEFLVANDNRKFDLVTAAAK
jgi:hypothetical protein